jgi:hypothetical protein
MVMSRSVVALSFLLLVASASAQDSLHSKDSFTTIKRLQHHIELKVSADYNANTLRNELIAGLWRGSFLERELRERTRDDLKERNSTGYAMQARLSYIGPTTGRWRQVTSVAYHEQVGVRFPRDLYNLTFFGNANYEGRRADLGPAAFTRIQYQTIGFGVQDVRHRHYARVDLVLGQSYDAVDLRWASLYTGVDGRVLRANLLGDHWRSDTSSSAIGSLNGLGLAVSGKWSTHLSRTREGRIAIEVQDLGFVGWGRNSLHLHKDSTLEYSGIRVASILDLDNVVIGEDQLVDTLGLRYEEGAFTKPLPFLVKASIAAPLGDSWWGVISVDQRYMPGYVPQVIMEASRFVGRRARTVAGAQVSMGGFGGLRIGARVNYRIGTRLWIALSTPHLPGFFLGGTRGAGAAFAVEYGF